MSEGYQRLYGFNLSGPSSLTRACRTSVVAKLNICNRSVLPSLVNYGGEDWSVPSVNEELW